MININIKYDDCLFKNRIEYTFNFIFQDLINEKKVNLYFNTNNIFNNSLIIIYSKKNPNIVEKNIFWIPSQNFIFSDEIIKNDKININKYKFKNKTTYSIERNEKKEEETLINENIFSFDLIETIFFHISRYEEYYANNEQKDHHSRMKSSEQTLVKYNLEKKPIVDELVLLIYSSLKIKYDNKKTIYTISHDIDAIRKFPDFYKFSRALARIVIKDKSIIKFLKLLKQYIIFLITKKDPYDTFDWLIKENKADEKVIYFMTGGITKYDNFYSIDDPKLTKYFELIKKHNYIIGLHPSYDTWKNNIQFQKELFKLNKITSKQILNVRQHILHFSINETIEIFEKNNIKFDSTLGYEDKIGFRCATGKDYYLYNFIKDRKSTVKETPLVIMDGPLLMEASYNIVKAEEILFNFLKDNSHNTKITFNFHNSIFDDVVSDKNKLINLYKNLNCYIND